MRLVFLDTNLLLLVVVGRTDRSYLGMHKRTKMFDLVDYDVVETLVAAYDGIATTPHVLAETSNLLGQVRNPAKDRIRETLRLFILESEEQPVASAVGCVRNDFIALGLTDAIILAVCEGLRPGSWAIDLLTADEPLYNRALSLGVLAELYA